MHKRPKPECDSVFANTSKKVRELKSELLAAAAAAEKLESGEAGELEQDADVVPTLDWNGSLYGDSLLAKKQKKPRVTKAQDTKPLTLGGRSSDRELLELEAFAQHFKQQRIKHGKPEGGIHNQTKKT
ncbi:hypothetical protein AAVH_35247 [Aphelenchoides avenae]|nr:hypothetical protein AAVH_35247 [Aphelenchus avenae]